MLIKVVRSWEEIRQAFEDDNEIVICENDDFKARWDEDLCIVITMPRLGRTVKESLKNFSGCEMAPYSIQLFPRFVVLGTVLAIRAMLERIKEA